MEERPKWKWYMPCVFVDNNNDKIIIIIIIIVDIILPSTEQ